MKNKELITELSNRLEWNSQEVTDMLDSFCSIVGTHLIENDTICLPDLGNFEVKKKADRVSVNPVNGKRYLVPPKLVAVFKPSTALKAKLKEITDNE
ncbi:MAG: HU family DNA-binding protein [Tannerellaceae bacterium]|jgi:DNA-binding protein HU-beta|nr:HU family DNA-binding protein [uncultured Macellibacteroides sp.]MBN2661359.1 HU family DNA-binding protein [Tannerellaceae bacterium]MBP7486292.1 HU family DNA-binding protein [Parabacteroides sp.]MCE5226926.1 HU family DNA-binding protein [Porphyromonadaceae bacterium]MBP8758547.1 HU family DNA-binding protein [Parabacteroides sp.]MBP9480178.1 HU family DNA-binding protein [Parabacteroides sp.]